MPGQDRRRGRMEQSAKPVNSVCIGEGVTVLIDQQVMKSLPHYLDPTLAVSDKKKKEKKTNKWVTLRAGVSIQAKLDKLAHF